MGTRIEQSLVRLAVMTAVALPTAMGAADQPDAASSQRNYFEQHVRPLLIERCYECHAGQKRSGELSLETRLGWQRGGNHGPAIVPEKPDESLLIRAVRYQNDDLQMPPDRRLASDEVAVLENWVRMGAPDPREGGAGQGVEAADSSAVQNHWAFQPLAESKPPNVSDASWPIKDVDRFILARLERRSWRPSPDANRYSLLRRVSFDLTGLPPTPAEIDSFIADSSERAYERVVDRLLESRAFGERWARPWLDLVGYADQIGSANNVPAEEAWRYRDYVIRAFNADKPFDQFIRDQLAGDLLTASTIEDRRDQITATGFLVLGNVNIVESDKLAMRTELVGQQIEKTGKSFLGMTLQCARCHDHKFDPITLQDYYRLAGIFASTESTYQTNRGVWSSVTKAPLPETLVQFTTREAAVREHERIVAAAQKERAEVDQLISRLDSQIATAKQAMPVVGSEAAPRDAGSTDAASVEGLEKQRSELQEKSSSLQKRLWHLEYVRPTLPVAFAVKDGSEIADAHIHIRGNPRVLGETVPRGFIQVIAPTAAAAMPADQSGRKQLADWLVGPAKHLVARVTVNRLWQRLFGRGLVASADYFGVRGETPTHPDLLDHIAQQFIAAGWSQKRLLRQLVLSRTYRQRSEADASAASQLAADPDNRMLWRMSPRRLEAEMLRDAALAVSGELTASAGGSALATEFIENVGELEPKSVNPISYGWKRFREDQRSVRSIYLPIVRSSEQPGPADPLNFFDFPQPAQYTGERSTTAVASQALFLLNGPLLKEAAGRLVKSIQADRALTGDEARLTALYRHILNRPPTTDEYRDALAFLASTNVRDSVSSDVSDSDTFRVSAWQQLAHALLISNEFLFRL
ncbi:MAG: PSD1 domain-containing protein [Pirellulales bacterium]|nr:PSD1 domain-containing protein [Pirellulales bacterium]